MKFLADKKTLRQHLLTQRLNLPDKQARSDALQYVMQLWLAQRKDITVGAYWPIKGEFDPLPALRLWQEEGLLLATPQHRQIGLPVVDALKKTLSFYAWSRECAMEQDVYGIPHPKNSTPVTPSLLFVPCLGYGPGAYRLGYGAGFYDRTLAALTPRPFTVGLAFSCGFVENLMPEQHDIALDLILNENGVV